MKPGTKVKVTHVYPGDSFAIGEEGYVRAIGEHTGTAGLLLISKTPKGDEKMAWMQSEQLEVVKGSNIAVDAGARLLLWIAHSFFIWLLLLIENPNSSRTHLMVALVVGHISAQLSNLINKK